MDNYLSEQMINEADDREELARALAADNEIQERFDQYMADIEDEINDHFIVW